MKKRFIDRNCLIKEDQEKVKGIICNFGIATGNLCFGINLIDQRYGLA